MFFLAQYGLLGGARRRFWRDEECQIEKCHPFNSVGEQCHLEDGESYACKEKTVRETTPKQHFKSAFAEIHKCMTSYRCSFRWLCKKHLLFCRNSSKKKKKILAYGKISLS